MDFSDYLTIIIGVFIGIVIIGLIISLSEQEKEWNKIPYGEVIDKEFVNGYSVTTQKSNNIQIEVKNYPDTYKLKIRKEKINQERWIVVDKETYYKYVVGDSYDLREGDKNE